MPVQPSDKEEEYFIRLEFERRKLKKKKQINLKLKSWQS